MEDWMWFAGLAAVWLLGDVVRGHYIRRGLDGLAASIDRHREAMELDDDEGEPWDTSETWKRGRRD